MRLNKACRASAIRLDNRLDKSHRDRIDKRLDQIMPASKVLNSMSMCTITNLEWFLRLGKFLSMHGLKFLYRVHLRVWSSLARFLCLKGFLSMETLTFKDICRGKFLQLNVWFRREFVHTLQGF